MLSPISIAFHSVYIFVYIFMQTCMLVVTYTYVLYNTALHFGTCAKFAISLAAPLFAFFCYLCKKPVTL